ncbi:MAG: DNA internalization-related competence protein ComEC/Rec2 [Deltaproteobacteria bacterium]|nr:DNA internalization-related competence protein ComEC/Rec2 [Deltaproteobacteria bacterium]
MPVVVLFFGAMLGAAAGLSFALPLVPLIFLAMVIGGSALVAKTPAARALAVLAFIIVVAGVSARVRVLQSKVQLPEGSVVVEGVVVDVGFGDEGQRLLVDVDAVLQGTAWSPLALRLDVSLLNARVEPGDRVRLRASIHEPSPALSPGTFDGEAFALSRGVHGHASVQDPSDVVVVAHDAAPFFVSTRLRLRERLLDQLPPRQAGLLLALLIGDTSLFEEEQTAAYRHVGAGHLLAVSGLQVTLLAVLLQRLCSLIVLLTPAGRRGRGFVVGAVVAVVSVWGFVALCGMPPSAVRAGVMATLVVVGQSLGRRVTLLDVLSAAGLLTVLASPVSILDAGFLLSYAAVLGLAAAAATSFDLEEAPSLWQRVRPALVASLIAGLATLPLSAWLFGQVAPAGLVANVVLVPVASALQLPALVGGALGAVLDLPWLSAIGAQAALLLESLVFGLASVLPGVRTIDAPSALTAVVLTTTSLSAAALLVSGRSKAGAGGVVLALVVLALSMREPGGMRVTFLPVGQGDGAVIELPDGSVFVVDAGGRVPFDPTLDEAGRAAVLAESGKRVVVPFLQRRGLDRVDVMVLSHPHPDHAGGLRAVVDAVAVKQFWWAGDDANGLVAPLIAKVPVVKSTPGLIGRYHFGEATVDVLAPAPQERTPTYPELGANDNSLVLRFCLHGGCVLLPGDIERFGEELLLSTTEPERLRSVIVKAPHHGSKTSSSQALIAASKAQHVVLCTGRHNTFGFPDADVVQRWRSAGAHVWDTAQNGEVSFWVDGDDVTVAPFR